MIFTQEHFRHYAKIFNRPTFLALANGEDPRLIFSEFDTLALPTTVKTVGDLFRFSFNSILKSYRNEYIYKTIIANKIVFGRHSPKNSAVCIELPVGDSIADIAIYNGTSTAYEIKTELDTPRRLETQTSDYLRAFEHTYIVTHPRLAEKYADCAHSNLGVISVSARGSLKTVKPAVSNLENIDANTIFRILRKKEFTSAVQNINGEPLNIANGLVRAHCQKIFLELDKNRAHKIYVDALKKRTTADEHVLFLRTLPEHLRVLGYATSLSKIQKARLLKSLAMPIQ